jgi:hypothetical protein
LADPLLLLPPPQPIPAAKNISSISPSPATRRRRREETARPKTPTSSVLLLAANQPKPWRGRSEADAPDITCGAVVLTVSVEVPEPLATEVGLNEHLGAGVPPPVMLQARLTVPLKPFIEVMVIVEVDDPPAETVAGETAEAAIPKSGVITVRLMDVLWLTDPEVPVIVTLEVATGVAAVVVIVSVDVPDVTELGVNAQLAPVGRLDATHVRSTAPLNPFVGDTVMVEVPDCPGAETLIGVPPTEKSGVATKPGHEVTNKWASMEPSPVTRS